MLKLTNGNESLHHFSNDNGVRVVNVDTSKSIVVKSTTFPYRNIHKLTFAHLMERCGTRVSIFLLDRRRHSSTPDARSFRPADCDTDHYLVRGDYVLLFQLLYALEIRTLPKNKWQITVAARSKVWTVLSSLERWDRGFESHSRHEWLCVRIFYICVVLCICSGHATGWSLVQIILPSV
jgi:hypothetical protein